MASSSTTKSTSEHLQVVEQENQPEAPQADQPSPGLADNRRPLSEVGNAERLVDRHGQDIRYIALRKKWSCWDSRRWKIGSKEDIERLAIDTIRAIPQEIRADDSLGTKDEIYAWAQQSEKASAIANMIKLAQHMVAVKPDGFDRHPYLLNTQNGTVDLKTGLLRPHRREDLITQLLPVNYDPDARCPQWDAFLFKIMGGNQEMVDFLQRASGYALTGDVSEQVIFILYGLGANGKSTFLSVLLQLFGEYAKQASSDLLLVKRGESHPTEVADLFGIRLTIAVEVPQGRALNEVLTKQLTGGDAVSTRKMREDFWQFKPTNKPFIAANHRPTIKGTDHGIWRRIRMVPFNVTISDKECIKGFDQKLLNEEAPGILAWAVRGCLAWQKHGLGMPEVVEAAVAEYREELDVVGAFIQERCTLDAEAQVLSADLYRVYVEWSKSNAEPPMTKADFGARLGERGLKPHRGSKGARFWRGITVGRAGDMGDVG